MAHKGKSGNEMLSARERQLLELAAGGFTDHDISAHLGISLASIGTYWGRVRIKFGPHGRTELVAMFLKGEFRKSYEQLKGENTILHDHVDTNIEDKHSLQVSLQLFRGLIETAPNAILVLNDQARVEVANEQTHHMFGYDGGELPGLTVESILPKWYHQGYLRNVLDHATNGDGRAVVEHIATTAKRKDQSEFPVAASLNATPSPRGLLVTCILRDEGGNLGLGSEEPVAYPSPRAVRLR